MNASLTIDPQGACLLDDKLLHPARHAYDQARAEVDQALEGLGPDDLLVVAGPGLGWHLKALLDAPEHPRLLLYEPDRRRLALMHCLGPWLRQAPAATSEAELARILGKELVYGRPGRARVFAPPAFEQAEPELCRQARGLVDAVASRARSDRDTRRARGGGWLNCLAANFGQVTKIPDLTLPAGVFSGTPALVIGAGPSLDQSLAALQKLPFGTMVLAAASAIGPLARTGVWPHLALALEAKDESRQFAGADPKRTVLAAALSGHPNHFANWPGLAGLFHLQPWTAALTGLSRALPSGGHATSAAFSLAALWGCDPIILVGQDLAYTGGKAHASGRPGGEDGARPQKTLVEAIGGGEVTTSVAMHSYIEWYREAAAFLATADQPPRLINASFAGALIPGMEHMPLDQALGLAPPGQDPGGLLPELVRRLPKPPRGHLLTGLAALRSQVRGLLLHLQEPEAQGLEEGAAACQAARFALDDLPRPLDQTAAAKRLELLLRALRSMEDKLHG